MKYSEKIKAEAALRARLAAEDAKASTGSAGKLLDYLVRDYLMSQGVRSAADVRCRRQDKLDWSIRCSGRTLKGETKSACGAVLYGKGLTKADISAEAIYPQCQYIAYAVETWYLTEQNFTELVLVFTREEFIQMLEDTGKHGLQSSLKVGKKGGQIEIQPWSTGKCTARLDKYLAWVEAHGIPTLEEFRSEVRG